MKKLVSALFFATMLFVAAAPAKAEPIEVGALDFPPYYQVTPEGAIKGGLYVEMITSILDRAKIPYVMKGYPAKRLYANVGAGTTHVWMGTIGVADYEGKTLVSPVPTSEIHLTAYSLGNEASMPKSLDDLKGKTLITIHGYNYGGVLKFLDDPANNIKTQPAKEHEQAFKMLEAGRAPFLLDYQEPANAALANHPVKDLKTSVIKTVPIYINVAKTTPDAQGLMDKMMKAYEELKAEGKF